MTSSSTEAEYIVASEAIQEAVWIRNLLIAFGVVQGASSPLDVYCDHNGAIAQAKEPRQHQKNKHIRMRYHQIREFVEDGSVMVCKIHTDSNVVDPLTKPLSQPAHEAHTSASGGLKKICPRGNHRDDYISYVSMSYCNVPRISISG